MSDAPSPRADLPGRTGAYGRWAADIAPVPPDAVQLSPLHPGGAILADEPDATFGAITLLAPPGTIERRYALAQALRLLAPGGRLVALAPKDRGGARLERELAAFGCAPAAQSRRHHRICEARRPEALAGIAEAIAEGAPRLDPALGLWTQPGIFSWDRLDPGSALLARSLPTLSGRGADLGCGLGILAHRVLASPAVTALTLVDTDARAVACARRNVDDPRAAFVWGDARASGLAALDFVVSNPPFHDGAGGEDQGLGQAFIRAAAAALRRGGRLWLVANRHLPYEVPLRELFAQVETRVEEGGFKVIEARK